MHPKLEIKDKSERLLASSDMLQFYSKTTVQGS